MFIEIYEKKLSLRYQKSPLTQQKDVNTCVIESCICQLSGHLRDPWWPWTFLETIHSFEDISVLWVLGCTFIFKSNCFIACSYLRLFRRLCSGEFDLRSSFTMIRSFITPKEVHSRIQMCILILIILLTSCLFSLIP